MSIGIEHWQEVLEEDYLGEKSILYIGSFENNTHNIEAFQKKFKLFESSLNHEYILKNLHKYDIVFFIDTPELNILQEIRQINTQIPILVYSHHQNFQIIRYLKYNIAQFLSPSTSTLEIILICQHELRKAEIEKKSIHSQKEQQEYLKILDDFIIISRTDLKGRITYVNEIFCEISGYNQEELLGSHHNIVRHPDMPQEAFQKMWNTIKGDNIWTGVVKNKAKNGETYIAKSTIIPYYENEVKVGYLGLRYVITDEVTEKSAIKAYLTKSVIEFKKQLREKEEAIERHLQEIEFLKRSSSDDTYMAWQRELKKKEKIQQRLTSIEEEIKEKENIYSKRVEKFLAEKRENDTIIARKNGEIRVLTDEKNTLNELLQGFKIDMEEKLSYIEQLQKRNQELEDVLNHREEELKKLR